MRLYNIYILTVAVLLLATTVIIAFLGRNTLGEYYTVFVIEALITTELFAYFNTKARRELNRVSTLLTCGFLVIVALEVFKLLV